MKLSEDSEDLCRTLTQRLRQEITSCSTIMLPCYIAGLSRFSLTSQRTHRAHHRCKNEISHIIWTMISLASFDLVSTRPSCVFLGKEQKKDRRGQNCPFLIWIRLVWRRGYEKEEILRKKRIIKIINSTTTKKWKKLLFYFFHVKWPIITHQHKSPFLYATFCLRFPLEGSNSDPRNNRVLSPSGHHARIYEYAADAAAVGVNKCEWGGIVRDDVF